MPNDLRSKIVSFSFATIFQIGLLTISFVNLYAHTLNVLIHDWKTNEDFSHGFLIPIISGYMIWANKEKLVKKRLQSSFLGLAIILFAMAMYIVGNIGAELFVQRSSIIACLFGITLYLFGVRIAKGVCVPLIYLFFMIPIPAIIWNQIAFPLQLLAAKLSVSVIQLLGITVLREGNILQLSNTSLEVVNACSGIRSLTTLLAISGAFAYLSGLNLVSKWVIFLAAIPLAIIGNIIRLTFTSVLAHHYGPDIVEGALHKLSGVIVFGVAMILLLGCYKILVKIEKKAKIIN